MKLEEDFEPASHEFEYIRPELFTLVRTPRKSLITLSNTLQHEPKDKNTNGKYGLGRDKQGSMELVCGSQRVEFKLETDFPSSCLGDVTQIEPNTYRIAVKPQSNSRKPCEWFYFSCVGLKHATFLISGLKKSKSLFSQGMKVSVRDKEEWRKGGYNISYYEEEGLEGTPRFYCLKFSYRFPTTSTLTFFAPSYPYSYNKLQSFLSSLQKHPNSKVQTSILTKTYLNNNIYCLTIGNIEASQVVVISARVHPGQTVSSFIVESFVEYLLEGGCYARMLRQNFLFKIFPMLNPDGVILGHYRLSSTGRDLNRMWKAPTKYTPEIYNIKKYLVDLSRSKSIKMVVDIHGHSRQKNAFFFGCPSLRGGECSFKEFPYLMSQIDSSFRFENCSFKMESSKAGTMRQMLFDQLKVSLVYTLECSLCGDKDASNNYAIDDLKRIGRKLGQGLSLYLSRFDVGKTFMSSQIQTRKRNILMTLKDCTKAQTQDSDSDPSQGCLDDFELEEGLREARCNPIRRVTSRSKGKPMTTLRERLQSNKRQINLSGLKSTIDQGGDHSCSKQEEARMRVNRRVNRLKSSFIEARQNNFTQKSVFVKAKQAKLMDTGLSFQLRICRTLTPSTTPTLIRPLNASLRKFIRTKDYFKQRPRVFLLGPELGCRRIDF